MKSPCLNLFLFIFFFCCSQLAAQKEYHTPMSISLIDPTFDHRRDEVILFEQKAAEYHIKTIDVVQNDVRIIGYDTTRKNNVTREHFVFSATGKILVDSSLIPAKYYYDTDDRLIKIVGSFSITKYIYNKMGKVQVVIDSGMVTDKQYYTYDSQSKPVKCEYFTYYSKTNQAEKMDSTLEEVISFEYDAFGRLTVWKRTGASEKFERSCRIQYDSTGTTVYLLGVDSCAPKMYWNKANLLSGEVDCFGPFGNNQYLKTHTDFNYTASGDIASLHEYSNHEDLMQIFQNYYLPGGLLYMVTQSYKKANYYDEFLYSYTFYK
jgi:hypothetical protein